MTTETVQPFEVQVAEVCQLSVIQLLKSTDTHRLVDISVGVGSWERRADWPRCDCAGCERGVRRGRFRAHVVLNSYQSAII